MRVGDLEFLERGGGRPPEIVHWFRDESRDGEFCCTIMFYERDGDGYEVRFVGSRPFDHWEIDLWRLMEYAHDVLKARLKLERNEQGS